MILPIPPELLEAYRTAAAFQDHGEVLRLFAQARERAPARVDLRFLHAQALAQCDRPAQAREALAALVREAPPARVRQVHALAATLWRSAGRNDLAEPHLRLLLADPASPPNAHEAMGDVLERLNKVEEAESIVAEGLRKAPDAPALHLLAARLARRRGKWEYAEEHLRRAIALSGTSPLASELLYELGHALDGQGRYREAFAAFQGAKAHMEGAGARTVWRHQCARMRAEDALPSAQQFRQWARADQEPAACSREAFLIGCPRSGTTLIERVLDAHDGIASASETGVWRTQAWLPLLKEIHAAGALREDASEAAILAALAPAQCGAVRRRYRAGMDAALEGATAGRFCIDKNPSLLPQAAALARVFPGTRLLMALRDPRAILWSCFTQPLALNSETVAFLEVDSAVEHIAVQLDFWLRLRDRLATPWHEVRYENMVQDLPGEAKKALAFLGVPWDDRVLDFHKNKTPVRSPSYASASQPIYGGAVDKWRHYEEFMAPHLAPLKPVMENLGYAW